MADEQTLAQRIRAKYPGAYDDLTDQQIEEAVLQKFPGVYDDVPRSARQQLVEGVKAFGREINPVPMIDAVGKAVIPAAAGEAMGLGRTGPVAAVQGVSAAQGVPYQRMVDAYSQGDYVTALAHGMYWLMPFIGPKLSDAAVDLREGRPGEAVGKTLGVTAASVGPAAIPKGGLKVASPLKNRNPVEQAAVEFGQREGIPVDAATATGNRFVRGVQKVADESALGSVVAGKARQSQTDAFARVGDRLASRAHPQAVSPEQAGQAVRDAVTGKVRQYHGEATTQYDALRAIEALPSNQQVFILPSHQASQIGFTGTPTGTAATTRVTIGLPVNVRAVKAQLRPIYQRMQRQLPITQQRSSPGLKAIENIVNGPDIVPLSMADADLSAIKSIGRGADLPELRDVSQGLAARAVHAFDEAVQRAAQAGGPDAVRALAEGRKATVSKYGAAGVLDKLRTEPVQVFNQAIWQKDAGIEQLREVAKLAPDEMPKIGRAYLEDLFTTATKEGAFDGARGLAAQWARLGPQTKQLLFRDQTLVRDLDNFFLLAKRAAENPNPSGTALTLTKTGEIGLLVADPLKGGSVMIGGAALAKLLHSPRAVRALTRSFQLPGGKPVAATAATAEVLRLAREARLPAAAPMSEESPAAAARSPRR